MRGKLVVVSGFSGAGKGTVIRKLMEAHEGYVLSVSMTTRLPREGETDGVEYHFVTNDAFEELIRQDGFLEHAGYVDHYYGTPRAFVEENRDAGRNVLLEIEVQGAMQIRDKFPEAMLIFMTPPSAEDLRNRLMGRGTENLDTARKRLQRAAEEVESIPAYPYLLINDDIDACAASLHAVINGGGEEPSAESGTNGGEIITDLARKEAFARKFSRELHECLESF